MVYAFLSVVNEMRFYQLYDSYVSHVPSPTASCYFEFSKHHDDTLDDLMMHGSISMFKHT